MVFTEWVLFLAALCIFNPSKADDDEYLDEWSWQFPVSQGSGFSPMAYSLNNYVPSKNQDGKKYFYSDPQAGGSETDSSEYKIESAEEPKRVLNISVNWDSAENSLEHSKAFLNEKKNSYGKNKPQATPKPIFVRQYKLSNTENVLWDKPKIASLIATDLIKDKNAAKLDELSVDTDLNIFEKKNNVQLWNTFKTTPLLQAREDKNAAFIGLPADRDFSENTKDISLWDEPSIIALLSMKLIKDKYGVKFLRLPMNADPFKAQAGKENLDGFWRLALDLAVIDKLRKHKGKKHKKYREHHPLGFAMKGKKHIIQHFKKLDYNNNLKPNNISSGPKGSNIITDIISRMNDEGDDFEPENPGLGFIVSRGKKNKNNQNHTSIKHF